MTSETTETHSPEGAEQPEEEITQTVALQTLQPQRKFHQKVAITRGPFDPGGQPDVESPHRLLVGLWGWNVSCGTVASRAVLEDRDRFRDYWQWPRASALVKSADRAGFDFELPFERRFGYAGEIGFHEDSLDSLTTAPALAQVTENLTLFSSIHMNEHAHPLHIARFGGNFDHVSNGRWGLNIVPGWSRRDAEVFGLDTDYSLRYEIADEFVTLMKHWWSLTTPFEFEGEYFKSTRVGMVGPRPTRQPRPILICGDASEGAVDFAAKHCDWLLCNAPEDDLSLLAEHVERTRVYAAHNYGRRLKMLVQVFMTMAETAESAQAEYDELVAAIDSTAADNIVREALEQPGEAEGLLDTAIADRLGDGSLEELVGTANYRKLAIGFGGIHLMGSFDDVAEQLRDLADDHMQDAVALSFLDPMKGVHEVEDELMPRLKKMGLRA